MERPVTAARTLLFVLSVEDFSIGDQVHRRAIERYKMFEEPKNRT
jgi:hypothetical protein